MTEQAVFISTTTASYTTPHWLAEKVNLRKISYQFGIHKELKKGNYILDSRAKPPIIAELVQVDT